MNLQDQNLQDQKGDLISKLIAARLMHSAAAYAWRTRGRSHADEDAQEFARQIAELEAELAALNIQEPSLPGVGLYESLSDVDLETLSRQALLVAEEAMGRVAHRLFECAAALERKRLLCVLQYQKSPPSPENYDPIIICDPDLDIGGPQEPRRRYPDIDIN